MSRLDMKGVQKRFRTRDGVLDALGPLDLGVSDGEFVCIVGPSGCGKSTLLHLAAGLEFPEAGALTVAGREVRGPSPDRLLIFQDGGLFPWLSVRDNVEFGLRLAGVPAGERKARAGEWIERVQLGGFAEARVHELSGGMRQRVALARGLVVDPAILLMDEPFAALDAQTRDRLGFDLQKIWGETRKTVVFITHNLREAACLGDRVLVMSRRPGRIIREIRVDLPRPRRIEDEGLIETIRPLMDDLRRETSAAEAQA